MRFNKCGFLGKVLILLAIFFCLWFFIYILPSTTVCKMGYKNKINTLFAIASIVNGNIEDIAPIENVYNSWSILEFLWPLSFPGFIFGMLMGGLLRKLTVEEKLSESALEKISELNFSYLEKKIAVLNYLKEVRERTQDYPVIVSENKKLKLEINRLNLNYGMQNKDKVEIEKELEAKDKELQKARSKIQRLEKRGTRGKTVPEE